MKAIAVTQALPASNHGSLVDIETPKPSAKGRDLLVRVQAISVNPVDYKVRQSHPPGGAPRILGWDAAGTVEAVGEEVTLFKSGDHVYYAGDITRAGSNAEFQLVDERIVGRKPQSLSFAEAAALPLTAITAWEALFERLGIDRHGGDRGRSLLIIAGAGGVGSIAIQLAKFAGLEVIATASRPETVKWCRDVGATNVIDHREPLPAQLAHLGFNEVDFVANFANTDLYWEAVAHVIRPQGKIVSIVENAHPLDLDLLKSKSATFVWEFMFTRSKFQTSDMAEQGALLNELAALIDLGKVRTTLTETLSPLNAATLREVHQRSEAGSVIGKLVIEGWLTS